MKNITLIIALLFGSFIGYSQINPCELNAPNCVQWVSEDYVIETNTWDISISFEDCDIKECNIYYYENSEIKSLNNVTMANYTTFKNSYLFTEIKTYKIYVDLVYSDYTYTFCREVTIDMF